MFDPAADKQNEYSSRGSRWKKGGHHFIRLDEYKRARFDFALLYFGWHEINIQMD